MGAVYEAVRADDEFEKRVAVKFVRPDVAAPRLADRFRRERQILASLAHPHIAALLDGGVTDEGQPYLVMEYVDGETIGAWCDRRALSVRERLRLCRDICAAVQHAHANLIVHRDLKPANVLVTAAGDVKLLDFGIAKLLRTELPNEASVMPGETLPGSALQALTPEYASPEQLAGQPVTTASDVYSLGALLYELVVGRPPFALGATSFAELARAYATTNQLRRAWRRPIARRRCAACVMRVDSRPRCVATSTPSSCAHSARNRRCATRRSSS